MPKTSHDRAYVSWLLLGSGLLLWGVASAYVLVSSVASDCEVCIDYAVCFLCSFPFLILCVLVGLVGVLLSVSEFHQSRDRLLLTIVLITIGWACGFVLIGVLIGVASLFGWLILIFPYSLMLLVSSIWWFLAGRKKIATSET